LSLGLIARALLKYTVAPV